MKLSFLLLSFLFLLVSCGEDTANQSKEKDAPKEETDSTQVQEEKLEEILEKENELPISERGFWIINIAAAETEQEAIRQVIELRKKDPKYGYLWIPDFTSLSGKELFAIFKGPYSMESDVLPVLLEHKKEHPKSYAVKVLDTETNRYTIHGKFDFRLNKKKQNLVLTYSRPEDVTEYAESGGEDWAFFVDDVRTYMKEHHPDLKFESLYYSGYSDAIIKKIQKELDLEGFGYICIKPNGEKFFIPHDFPQDIIEQINVFFENE